MSTIKLYRSTPETSGRWKLLASRLFKIEDIEAYLATISSSLVTTINNFQYIKTELEISIKLDMTQINAEVQNPSSIQYVSVQNTTNGARAYYFVKKRTSLSQKCIRLDLVLDVLNTYTDGTDYIFKKNTRIVREHKNRFITYRRTDIYRVSGTIDSVGFSFNVGDILYVNLTPEGNADAIVEVIEYDLPTEYFVFELRSGSLNVGRMFLYNNERYEDADVIEFTAISITPEEGEIETWRNIDAVNENINPMLQCRNAEGVNIETSISSYLLAQNWYLLYRNQNNPSESLVNPVECYLIPERATPVTDGMLTNGRVYASNLEYGKFYYIPLSVSDITGHITPVQQTISLPDGTILGQGLNYNLSLALALLQRNKDNTINVYYQNFAMPSGSISQENNYPSNEYIVLNSLPCPYEKRDAYVKTDDFWLGSTDMFNDDNMEAWDTGDTPNYLNSVQDLDRTESKNIKLIKLPYCPFNFVAVSSGIQVTYTPEWEYTYFGQTNSIDFYALKLRNNNTKLHSNMTTSNHPLNNLVVDALNPTINDLKRDNLLDSKLLHSEFYKPTYYYDSFSYSIALEKCDISEYIDKIDYNSLQIRFDVTSTINSRFMFSFTNYHMRFADQNYAHIMPITRNNEEVLYNVPYINYVRTGYNYDVKAKNLSNVANWTGVALSGASIVASLFAPGIPLKIAGVVGSLVSMAMSLKGAITASVQNEQTLQSKIQQTQHQTSSVAGSDDVDLMSVYADNRLKYIVYEPMPNMKSLLKELFFYAGYNSGRMGVPTHNSRVNFDYLECDAVLESVSANMSEEIITELVNTFKNGVTYIHKTDRVTDKWDIEQKYENWEVELLED